MRVVLDTNVVVSGILSPFGPPAQILELIAAGDIAMVVDDRIISEYAEVLGRREFGLDARDVEEFLDQAESSEHAVGVPLPFVLPDPDDEMFLELAIAGAVDALVTGNEKHFKVPGGRLAIPIVTPRRFLDIFSGR